MINNLATWLYLDDNEHIYYQVGKSGSERFKTIYWRCVYCFYKSCIITQENVQYYFFSNVDVPEDVDGFNLRQFMEDNNIKTVKQPYTYAPPIDWTDAWWAELYEFDILNYCKNIEGNWLVLDADCIMRKPLTPIFDIVCTGGGINYRYEYGLDDNINGLTLRGEREIYEDVFKEEATDLYHMAGEFVGIKSDRIEDILSLYDLLYKDSMHRYRIGDKRLITEDHFFTLIYYKLGFRYMQGGRFIKRMWSTKECDNICEEDNGLAIWHLPAEKTKSLISLFSFLQLDPDKEEYLNYLETLLAVGKGEMGRRIRRERY